MPRMRPVSDTDIMTTHNVPGPGNFSFSAARPETLGASEFTLVSIVVDESSSVQPFANDLLASVQAVIQACRQNPRSDHLMVRLAAFNSGLREIHGFTPLGQIDENTYPDFQPDGLTALYDAAYSAASATLLYARQLGRSGFSVNGAVYVITDGMDNMSHMAPSAIADRIREAEADDDIESMITVLVGLNPSAKNDRNGTSKYLDEFRKEAEMDRYVDAGAATPANLARLAKFVSQSISIHSMALGRGTAAPQSLSF